MDSGHLEMDSGHLKMDSNKVINQRLFGFKNLENTLEKPGNQQFGPWKNLENTLEKPGIGPLVRSGNPD